MAVTIKLKNASGSDPSASDLVVGEVAIRTDNGKLFTKKDNGTVAEITGGGGIDDGDKGDITVSNSGGTFTIDNGVVNNAKVASDAAIDGTKVDPDFGSQNVTTTGNLNGKNLNLTHTSPTISLTDSNNDDDFDIKVDGGSFKIIDATNSNDRFAIDSSGNITASGTFNTGSNVITGNITASGDANINGGDLTITGGEGTSAVLKLVADQGDDNGDGWRIISNQDDNDLTFSNNTSGSYADKLTLKNNGNLDVTGGIDVTGDLNVVGTANIQNGNTLDFGSATNNNIRGQIQATETNDAHLIIATSGGEDIAFKDGGVSGTTNMIIRGDGNVVVSNGSVTATSFSGALTGDVTGNADTATALETARTIAGVSFDGTANISLNNANITNGAGYITATLTNEQVQDIVGNMVTGNTESGITVTYQDGDGTLDFVVGTLNQDTTGSSASCTGNAATATALANARTIAGVSFDGTQNISLNNNAITNGAGYITATLTNEQVQDIVGNMVSGNSESGITVTYQDSDGTLDFSVASQTDNNFTTTLKNKLDGIAAGATVGLPTSGGELTGDLTTHVVKPDGNNTRTLGTSSARWSDVFTNDLHLSNKGGSNKVDNTWGDFTIQEGVEDLFLINNRSGKMYKFMLQEVN